MNTNSKEFAVAITKEHFNGWSNRETWAAYLWITNEEPLYKEAISIVRGNYEHNRRDSLQEFIGELLSWENMTPDRYMMRDDIGSLWRVDWREIVKHLIDDPVEWQN